MSDKTEIRLLSPGTNVYESRYNGTLYVIPIDRVTKTQAISKDGKYKFKREIWNDNTVSKINRNSNIHFWVYYVETPELIQKFRKQELIEKLTRVSYKDLSNDVLEKLYICLFPENLDL